MRYIFYVNFICPKIHEDIVIYIDQNEEKE